MYDLKRYASPYALQYKNKIFSRLIYENLKCDSAEVAIFKYNVSKNRNILFKSPWSKNKREKLSTL